MGRYAWGLATAAWLAGASAVQAQLPAVGVPRGVLRIETDGLFEAFDEQFRDGDRESYAAGLSSPALGSDRIPAFAAIDSRIDRITGTSGFRLTLGGLAADAHTDAAIAVLGASLGLSNRLTLFGRLPLVSRRTQSVTRLDPTTANAGVRPPVADQADFFDQFETALTTLQTKIANGDYDANPTTKALAEATLARGTSLQDDLFAVLGDAASTIPFAPTASSAAGLAVGDEITELQTTLSIDLGVAGFSTAPALPAAPLTAAEFESFVANDLGFRPGQTQLRFRGDAEAGLALTLVDRWNRGRGHGGLRMAATALLRFPTGARDRPDRLLDLGSGDGQTDIELGLVTDVGGGRWGARLNGTYVRQLEADVTVRVTSPSQPLVGPERLAVVRWNPGDVIAVGVRPFYRIVSTLALQAGVDHWRHAADQASYASAADAVPGVVAASAIAAGSKASATSVSAGLTYANVGALRPGGHGLPVEASWMFERVVTSGEGVVPAVQRVRASLRLYFQLFK